MEGIAAIRVARRRFDALHDETWRLYVDRDHQHHGPMVYDRGLHGRDAEPGFMESMASAHALASRELGSPLDRALLQRLHEAVLAHGAPKLAYRDHAFHVTVAPRRLQRGSLPWLTRSGAQLEEVEEDGVPRLRVLFVELEGGEESIVRRLERVLSAGRRAIARAKDADARLLAIARLHARLELLHPTEDGNTRRNLVLLDKLLVEHGFWPVILDEPNDVVVMDARRWAAALRRGMTRFQVAARAIAYGDDVGERLREHDRARERRGDAPDPAMEPDQPFRARGFRRVTFVDPRRSS